MFLTASLMIIAAVLVGVGNAMLLSEEKGWHWYTSTGVLCVLLGLVSASYIYN